MKLITLFLAVVAVAAATPVTPVSKKGAKAAPNDVWGVSNDEWWDYDNPPWKSGGKCTLSILRKSYKDSHCTGVHSLDELTKCLCGSSQFFSYVTKHQHSCYPAERKKIRDSWLKTCPDTTLLKKIWRGIETGMGGGKVNGHWR